MKKLYSSLPYLFIITETLLYDANIYLILISSILFYTLVLITLLRKKSRELGISLFIIFSLLAPNMSNYLWQETLPPSYYGLRIFGYSFNIFFTLLITVLTIKRNTMKSFSKFEKAVFAVFFYFLLIGIVNTLYGLNYLDDFKKDLLTIFPIFCYIILFKSLRGKLLHWIIENLINASFLGLLLSLLFSKTREYAIGEEMLLANTFSSTLIFALFFYRKNYSNWVIITLIVFFFYLIATNNIILGGKSIIYFILIFLWIFKNKIKIYTILIFGFITFWFNKILQILRTFFDSGVVANKIAQVQILFSFVAIETIALSKSSVGNIAGELLTIIEYFKSDFTFLLFGKGFGGGIPDTLGYLNWWAGNAGYKTVDAIRNNYHKMHLGILEMIVKGGLLIFIPYTIYLVKGFISNNKWRMLHVILFAFMFFVSKEFILMTLLYYYLGKQEDDEGTLYRSV